MKIYYFKSNCLNWVYAQYFIFDVTTFLTIIVAAITWTSLFIVGFFSSDIFLPGNNIKLAKLPWYTRYTNVRSANWTLRVLNKPFFNALCVKHMLCVTWQSHNICVRQIFRANYTFWIYYTCCVQHLKLSVLN